MAQRITQKGSKFKIALIIIECLQEEIEIINQTLIINLTSTVGNRGT